PPIVGKTTTSRVGGADVTTTTYNREVLTWDLQKSLVSLNGKALRDLTGAQLSVTLRGMKLLTCESAYLISLPLLKVGNNSLHIQGLNFRLNGFPINYATTFKELDRRVYQNTTDLLSPGTLVSIGPLGTA